MGNVTQIQLVTTIARELEQQGKGHVADMLVNAQHFEIDMEIFKAAARFVIDTIREGECFIDSIALPPASICTLRMGQESSLLLARAEGDRVELLQLTEGGVVARRYAWRCGTNELHSQSYFEPNTDEVAFVQGGISLTLPMMLTLINSPKLIEIEGTGQRQERRAAFRTSNIAVNAWHRVTWRTAAGNTNRSDGHDTEGPKKPLHYRRGHLRTAQDHYAGAFSTKLTSTGWGQWIDGRWVGHPSLGIKRAIHSPKLDESGLSKFIEVQKSKPPVHEFK